MNLSVDIFEETQGNLYLYEGIYYNVLWSGISYFKCLNLIAYWSI